MNRPVITLSRAQQILDNQYAHTNIRDRQQYGYDLYSTNQAVIRSRRETLALTKCNPADAVQLSIRSLTQYNGYKVRITLDNGQIIIGQLDRGHNGWQVWKDGQVQIAFRTNKQTVINTRPNGKREIQITHVTQVL